MSELKKKSMIEMYQRYLTQVPRYASYPTVKDWDQKWNSDAKSKGWLERVNSNLDSEDEVGVYVHLPFCETLCGFCGCNTSITDNHRVEEEYLQSLAQEWRLYLERVPNLRHKRISFLYLGGGTPNFFSSENLRGFLDLFEGSLNLEKGKVELDPRSLEKDLARVLAERGFRHASLGVQDFNDEVLEKMRPGQPYALVKEKIEMLREVGFSSISLDLLFGLPRQTESSWRETLEKVRELEPEGISLYRWVIPPWTKGGAQGTEEQQSSLPNWEMYAVIREALTGNGFEELGMDHFIREGASEKPLRPLTKTFSGYHRTSVKTVLGLGVSAISETTGAYHQNEKALPVYQRRVSAGEIPSLRGICMDSEQQEIKKHIFDLSTKFNTRLPGELHSKIREELSEFFDKEFLSLDGDKLQIEKTGRRFLRPICHWIENVLRAKESQEKERGSR